MFRCLLLICLLGMLESAGAVAHSGKCPPAKHASLEGLTIYIPISEFRERLKANGWQAESVPWQAWPSQDEGAVFHREYVYKQDFYEVQSCSPLGLAYCRFHWSDAYNNRLIVVTAGENENTDGVVDQTVTKFLFEGC